MGKKEKQKINNVAGATKNQPHREYFFPRLMIFTEHLLYNKPGNPI